jgi:hypothetical protein
VKGLFDLFKRKETYQESKTDKLIDKMDELIKSLHETTLAMQKLTLRMDMLEKKVEMLPAIEKDLSRLGQKVRDMAPKPKGKNV